MDAGVIMESAADSFDAACRSSPGRCPNERPGCGIREKSGELVSIRPAYGPVLMGDGQAVAYCPLTVASQLTNMAA